MSAAAWMQRSGLPLPIQADLARALAGDVVDLGSGGGSRVDPASSVEVPACGPRLLVRMDRRPGAGGGARAVCADLSAPFPLASAAFDAALLCHVLEHVRDPDHVLAETARVLRAGGFLIAAVPDGSSISDRLFRRWYDFFHERASPDYDGHVQRFSRDSFLRALAARGFDVAWVQDVDEAYSWLGKHPLARGALVRMHRALRWIRPATFRYGWYVVACRSLTSGSASDSRPRTRGGSPS
jgi:SAM-dependent methyltransferase